ncbi:MAG: hypothetical protein R3E44_10970 [Paracoccaceae bacterium]
MTDRKYDTRSREEILAAARLAPYLNTSNIDAIGLRELRTLDAFLIWAENTGVQVPSTSDFLAFSAGTGSARQLENLRTAFDRIAPVGAAIRQTVRDAIRMKRPRSRVCDQRPRDEIVAAAHFAPYRHLSALEKVALEDLRVLDRFLIYAEARRIEIPTVEDFLRFTGDKGSSRRLRNLKTALDALLPGSPAVLQTLQEAIRRKSPAGYAKPSKPRPKPGSRVSLSDLPVDWQDALSAMHRGEHAGGLRPPAESTLRSMEDVLREYAHVMVEAGLPVAITIDGIRRFETARAARAAGRVAKNYQDQGNRPATRHTAIQRIRAFAERLGLEPLVLSALRAHENGLRRDLGRVVPLKFGQLDRLPDLTTTWRLAVNLREASTRARRRQTRLRLLNEAAILALWTLLPLRLRDGQLRWGADIDWTGAGYRIDIDTRKADVALQGRLHAILTPFLDSLVLNGMDPAYLDALREQAMAQELPLFRGTAGKMLARGYPSTVWAKHMGSGAHIARARVHTELGRLGPEGVSAALALCAQSDPRSEFFYQGEAVRHAQIARGQDLMEALLDVAADNSEGSTCRAPRDL